MDGRTETIDWVGDDEVETTWDEEGEAVNDVDSGDGGKGARPQSRKRAKTTKRKNSSSDDVGAVVEGSLRLTNTRAAMTVDPRERHKLAERERRKSMRELFLSLHALLPNGDMVRTEQSAILDEIIKYIPNAVSRLRSLRSDAQRHRRTKQRSDKDISDPEIPDVDGAGSSSYTSTPSSSSSSSPLSSSSFFSDVTTSDRPKESSSPVLGYACPSRCDSTNSLNTLVTGSPSSGCRRKTGTSSTTLPLPGDICTVDIRVTPEPAASVSIRLRGDRVNVSLTDHSYCKQPTTPAPSSTQPVLLLSAVLDELEAHHLQLIRATHCRDGSKLLHYSESKIQPDQESLGGSHTPTSVEVLKRRLQHLASKLRTLRKTAITTTATYVSPN